MTPSTRQILVLHGPNLDLLGTREPEVYGRETLAGLTLRLDRLAEELGVALVHHQSNVEGELVNRIHESARAGVSAAIVNAGGYTHTSVAIRDALVGTSMPFVEVHLSNVWRREAFRHTSLLADVALGVIAGLGPVGYELALRALVERIG